MAMKPVNLGMLFNNAVQSTTAQGLFSAADVKARLLEFAAILEEAATELGVDLNESSWSGGGGDFERKPTKGIRFELDGQTWFDYRAAKLEGTVKDTFPDFKNYDTNEGVYIETLDGETNDDANALVAAADIVAALA